MSIQTNAPNKISRCYRITVEGAINSSWSEWFGNLQLVSKKTTDGMQITILNGKIADQAALRGLLNRLWDLNMILVSIHQVDPVSNSEME
jgi:hypothetical protein